MFIFQHHHNKHTLQIVDGYDIKNNETENGIGGSYDNNNDFDTERDV